jgi:ubiquinol-cytochrome c reductase cytochrome c subunit
MRISSFAILAALLSGPALAQDAQAPSGDIKNGEKHYISDGCYQCHGMGANGAALTGPRLARTELPYDAFATQLRHPSSDMPPYEAAIVSDKIVADLYAYVKSRPDYQPAKSVPLIMRMGVK